MSTITDCQDHLSEIVGLIPAGGKGTRIGPLPFSKELFPVGFVATEDAGDIRPKAVCQYLLEKMRSAGIRKTFIVIRSGKWDIPGFLGSGLVVDMDLAYLLMQLPYGVPFTIDQAYPFVKDRLVAFGFPDILFRPEDAFLRLIERLMDRSADVVLGLFPTENPETADMVDTDGEDRVRNILIKPARTDLTVAWIIAVWTPKFTQFLHEKLAGLIESQDRRDLEEKELYLGEVFQFAIDEGLLVEAVNFPNSTFYDIGNPSVLVKVLQDQASIFPPPNDPSG